MHLFVFNLFARIDLFAETCHENKHEWYNKINIGASTFGMPVLTT